MSSRPAFFLSHCNCSVPVVCWFLLSIEQHTPPTPVLCSFRNSHTGWHTGKDWENVTSLDLSEPIWYRPHNGIRQPSTANPVITKQNKQKTKQVRTNQFRHFYSKQQKPSKNPPIPIDSFFLFANIPLYHGGRGGNSLASNIYDILLMYE